MTDDFESLWANMQSQASGIKGGILRRRLTAARDDGLFLGFDVSKRQRLFIIELAPHIQFRSWGTPHWREIEVERITEDVSPDIVIVKIALISERFSDVFTAFAYDLYKTLAPLGKRPDVPYVLSERLEKWHRFFMTHGPAGLTQEEQLGLFGELWFLKHHVLGRMPALVAVKSWKGPEDRAHDFELPGGDIEAKVTGASEPRKLRISSEYQLDISSALSLYLYVASVEMKRSGGKTLPELVSDLRIDIEEEKSGGDMFRQKLMEAGYLDIHAGEYNTRYDVVEEFLFRVEEGFPRLTPVPEGVSGVRYMLSLSACLKFQVDLDATLIPLLGGVQL